MKEPQQCDDAKKKNAHLAEVVLKRCQSAVQLFEHVREQIRDD